jgi:2-polyprenyl-6-methoxyphenol hydroxylase-like FAD-dependent oxidoreductase
MLQDELGLACQRHTEITGYTIGAQTHTNPTSTNNFAYLTGRNFGLGDAAHAMLPHMGQGANQAIEDAMALATLLRETSAADVPDVLVHFQQLRRDRTARIQRLSRSNGVAFDAGSTVRLIRPWVQGYDVEADALAVRRNLTKASRANQDSVSPPR